MSGKGSRKERSSAILRALVTTLIIVSVCPAVAGHVFAGERPRKEVRYTLIPMVTIDDKETIDFFVEEFFLPETSYTSIEVIDTESNGFGRSDLLKFYPSGSMYYLDMVTDTAQKVMNRWEIEENVEIVTDVRDPGKLDSVKTAEYGILSALAAGVERNYGDAPININMHLDSTGIVFEMWGYNADSLQFTPAPPPLPDSVPVYDLLHSHHEEETLIPDAILHDLFFIYRSEVDTVFVGDGEPDATSELAPPLTAGD